MPSKGGCGGGSVLHDNDNTYMTPLGQFDLQSCSAEKQGRLVAVQHKLHNQCTRGQRGQAVSVHSLFFWGGVTNSSVEGGEVPSTIIMTTTTTHGYMTPLALRVQPRGLNSRFPQIFSQNEFAPRILLSPAMNGQDGRKRATFESQTTVETVEQENAARRKGRAGDAKFKQ